ncbi:carbonic anhydrase 2-like isoform X1 [Astyanax mexicanus]|nr:carbonic anhydrase 2-like isoform X1 [Astyanax mexicanus]XP_049341596.1 carbonic anhydrase 2-like isoform X1 [Astyanax mexicanus]
MQCWLLLTFLMLSNFKTSAAEVPRLDYCYKETDCNPYLWVKSYPSCLPQKDKLHSPIDLNDEAVRNDTVPALMFRGLARSGTVKNVRDTVVVDFDECMTVSGGWLKYKYRLVQIRFHWGSKTTNGSEHTLNNRRFPMEMQLVGVAPGYKDVKSALNQQSGVAMIGVFIDIGPVNNVHFKAISDAVSKVPYPGDSVKVTLPTLLQLMPTSNEPGNRIKFFYYQGGLTTPPCSQTVDWIVLENPVLISSEQYLAFVTHLYYSDKSDSDQKLLEENYRPIQSSAMHKVLVSAQALEFHLARGASRSLQTFFIPLCVLLSLLHLSLTMV